MIHPARLPIGLRRNSSLSLVESIGLGTEFLVHTTTPKGWPTLTKNSKPSSQRNRLVSRSSEALGVNQECNILPCAGPLNAPHLGQPGSVQHFPTACALFDVSDSPNKTHRTRVQQRFSSIHF